MPPYSDLQPGEIVITSADFRDGSEIKIRPALVISQNIIHQNSQGLIFLGMTTGPLSRFMLQITNKDLVKGSLGQPSSVIYDKPIWAEQTKIRKRVGRVKEDFLNQVMERLKNEVLSCTVE